MNCPVCKEVMIVLELEQVEADHCTACGGIWLDGSELELLLAGVQAKNDLLASFKIDPRSSEQKRKCPICSRNMQKVLCGSDHSIRIDRCQKNHGLWFDEGELQALIKSEPANFNQHVFRFLQTMFAVKNKKQEV